MDVLMACVLLHKFAEVCILTSAKPSSSPQSRKMSQNIAALTTGLKPCLSAAGCTEYEPHRPGETQQALTEGSFGMQMQVMTSRGSHLPSACLHLAILARAGL